HDAANPLGNELALWPARSRNEECRGVQSETQAACSSVFPFQSLQSPSGCVGKSGTNGSALWGLNLVEKRGEKFRLACDASPRSRCSLSLSRANRPSGTAGSRRIARSVDRRCCAWPCTPWL